MSTYERTYADAHLRACVEMRFFLISNILYIQYTLMFTHQIKEKYKTAKVFLSVSQNVYKLII